MSSDGTIGSLSQEELAQLVHLRELYEKTTKITSQCFDTCISRPTQGRVQDSEKNCLANCAANFMHAELLFARRLVNAANQAIQENRQ